MLVSGKQKDTTGEKHLTAKRAAIDGGKSAVNRGTSNNSGSRTTGSQAREMWVLGWLWLAAVLLAVCARRAALTSAPLVVRGTDGAAMIDQQTTRRGDQ